jgi:hypothetical protein
MKKSMIIAITIIFMTVILSKNITIEKNNIESKPVEDSLNIYTEEEKHFDCTVEECVRGNKDYAITTECGIYFHSDKYYKKGTILNNFNSPKHK